MATVQEYQDVMEKILGCVNKFPEPDRDVAMTIWRQGGCEALAIWASVNFQIIDMTAAGEQTALEHGELQDMIQSAMLEHFCKAMSAMLEEDCK